MLAVILAGGMGTRISEESHLRPKPMIEIGGRPILWHIMKIYARHGVTDFVMILWHIMKIYARHGVTDFVICLGYKGYMIKEYFANYFLHNSDVTIDARDNRLTYHQTTAEPWRITLVDTGETTLTGGRLKRVARYLPADEPFCFTYGDGVSDVDIGALVAFHKAHGKLATLTAVAPPGRYGALSMNGDRVQDFIEKPPGDNGLINGGFFVLHPDVLALIDGDQTPWESAPLETLARRGELMAWRHAGFWQPMDTLRDKNALESLWQEGRAPWKVWE